MKARFTAAALLLLPLFSPSADAQVIIELMAESYTYEIADTQNVPSGTYTLESTAHGYVPMLTFASRNGEVRLVRRSVAIPGGAPIVLNVLAPATDMECPAGETGTCTAASSSVIGVVITDCDCTDPTGGRPRHTGVMVGMNH